MKSPAQAIAESFGLDGPLDLEPRFNICPGQPIPIVRQDEGGVRSLAQIEWGLRPAWMHDRPSGAPMINVRAETAATRAAFRTPFRQRRCLIVADGFYEWQKRGSGKQPFYIAKADGRPFAFAGLWDGWRRRDDTRIETCAILTTEPNELLRPIHDRMPVILPPDAYATWLDSSLGAGVVDLEVLQELLVPLASDALETRAVGSFVNDPRHEGPECVAAPPPPQPEPQRLLF